MIKDLGLLDWAYAKFYASDEDVMVGDSTFTRTTFNEDCDETWVCFLPWRTSTKEAVDLGLIPKNHRAIVYEGPVGLVNPNPQSARDLQSAITEDVDKLNLKKFNVLAYSVGTYPGIYVANKFSTGRLVSVVPGDKLGSCIWDGIASQYVKEVAMMKYGIRDENHYDEIIKETNAMENLRDLPSDIEVYLASHDNYIKTYHGENLIQGLVDAGKRPKVEIYENQGHVLSIINFGKENKL